MLWSSAHPFPEPSRSPRPLCPHDDYSGHGVVYTITCGSRDTTYYRIYPRPTLQVWIDFAPSLHYTLLQYPNSYIVCLCSLYRCRDVHLGVRLHIDTASNILQLRTETFTLIYVDTMIVEEV
jgi:hypothetical protein